MLTDHLTEITKVGVWEVCKVKCKEKKQRHIKITRSVQRKGKARKWVTRRDNIWYKNDLLSKKWQVQQRIKSEQSYFRNKHLPTKIICYRHRKTMSIDCMLPSGLINKHISCISSMLNRHYLHSKTNGQLMVRCDIFWKIIAHKLMRTIRIS